MSKAAAVAPKKQQRTKDENFPSAESADVSKAPEASPEVLSLHSAFGNAAIARASRRGDLGKKKQTHVAPFPKKDSEKKQPKGEQAGPVEKKTAASQSVVSIESPNQSEERADGEKMASLSPPVSFVFEAPFDSPEDLAISTEEAKLSSHYDPAQARSEVASRVASLREERRLQADALRAEVERQKVRVFIAGEARKQAIDQQISQDLGLLRKEIAQARAALPKKAATRKADAGKVIDFARTALEAKTRTRKEEITKAADARKNKAAAAVVARQTRTRELGASEGRRAKDGVDQQATDARNRGETKAAGYPEDDRGQAQAEAVQAAAEEVAEKLEEPGPDLLDDLTEAGEELANGLDGAEGETVNSLDEMAESINAELQTQSDALGPQFDTLRKGIEAGIDGYVEQIDQRLQEAEANAERELCALQESVTGSIENTVASFHLLMDQELSLVLIHLQNLTETTAQAAERQERPDPKIVDRAMTAASVSVQGTAEQFLASTVSAADGVAGEIDAAGNSVGVGVAGLVARAMDGLVKAVDASDKGLEDLVAKAREKTAEIDKAWTSALEESQKAAEAKFDESVSEMEKEIDKGLDKSEGEIKAKVDEALAKNRESLVSLDSELEKAAAKARTEYDAAWYEKFFSWDFWWDALKSFLGALGKLLLLVVVAILGVILIIGGFLAGALWAIILGVILLLGALVFVLYGIITGIIERVKSAERWWQYPWAVVLGILDIVGVPNLLEGIFSRDFVNGRKLTEKEAAERLGAGLLNTLLFFIPLKLKAKGAKGKVSGKGGGLKQEPRIGGKTPRETPPKQELPREELPKEELSKEEPQPASRKELYNASRRSDAELQLDKDPTPRPGETPAEAAERARLAKEEIRLRKSVHIYEQLGESPREVNVRAEDAVNSGKGAHTTMNHGFDIPLEMPRDGAGNRLPVPTGAKSIEGRIFADTGWGKAENSSFRWKSDVILDKVVNSYLKKNWERIRTDLAMEGRHVDNFVAEGGAVGEGFFNPNQALPGPLPRKAFFMETNLVRIVIRLDPGPPVDFYIVTTFPNALGAPPR